jgi:hypothetical protein
MSRDQRAYLNEDIPPLKKAAQAMLEGLDRLSESTSES